MGPGCARAQNGHGDRKEIRKIIDHDQAGFIPETQERFNMQKSVNAIRDIHKRKKK